MLKAALVVLPLRLFLAAGWLRAGAEKVVDRSWWHGDPLHAFIASQHEAALPYFRPVMDHLVEPYAAEVAAVVAVAQVLIGIAILVGRPMRLALLGGVLLNVVFVMCGRVNPSAFYLVMEAAMLFAVSTRIVAHTPSTPSRRSLALVVGLLASAMFHVPYIRTIQPARVIEDPAMMLTFLSVIVATTTLLRWMLHRLVELTVVTEIDTRRVWTWVVCRPYPSVSTAVDEEFAGLGASWAESDADRGRDWAPPITVTATSS